MQMSEEMKSILQEVTYPAKKSEIIDTAKKAKASGDEMKMLEKIPDRDYQTMSEVTDAMSKMGMAM